jgi:hypothetical protein
MSDTLNPHEVNTLLEEINDRLTQRPTASVIDATTQVKLAIHRLVKEHEDTSSPSEDEKMWMAAARMNIETMLAFTIVLYRAGNGKLHLHLLPKQASVPFGHAYYIDRTHV